jgi:hypothetical protein
MPILGIIASQISGHLFTPGTFDSIQTVTVGSGGAASISFSAIPSTYKHLQIRCLSRNTSSSVRVNMRVGNGSIDTGTNYKWHSLGGDGSASFGYSPGGSLDYIQAVSSVQGSEIANAFGVAVIDILDYANTSKNKTFRILTGSEVNSYASGNYFVGINSAAWFSTSVINTITMYPNGAGNLAEFSQFALYGIQG